MRPSSYARPEGLTPIKSKRNKTSLYSPLKQLAGVTGLEKFCSHPLRIIEQMDLPCPMSGSDSPGWASSDPTKVESPEVISSGGHVEAES